jgi:hypothetical protein
MPIPICLPDFLPDFMSGVIRAVHLGEGDRVTPGTALADFSVDLSAGQSYDCAPIAHYRLVFGEEGRLARLDIRQGQVIAAHAVLGLLDLEPKEETAAGGRTARVMVASILHHDDWWDESP